MKTLLSSILLLVALAADAAGVRYVGTFVGDANGSTNMPGLIGQRGRTLYVDPATGSDATGNGTQEKPFKTIGYQFTDADDGGSPLFTKGGACGVAQPGDTLKLMPGDYTNEVVQLWFTNALGLSLIGSGQTVTRIFSPGNLLGAAAGMNIIQLGNSSLVSDLSCYGTTNFAKTVWYNPIGNAGHTYFVDTYWTDAVNGGNTAPNFQVFGCTNAVVKNFYGWGAYDGIYLWGVANYSITFSHCEFNGYWDLCALYGRDSNTVQTTEFQDCKFFTAGGGASVQGRTEAIDLHGGRHTFKDCTMISKDGSNIVNFPLKLGGTIGIFAEDGSQPNGQTNLAIFLNCNVHTFSTNASGVVALTNTSSAPGKSIVQFIGGSLYTAKSTNWVGACWDTNQSAFIQNGPTGSSALDGQGGASFANGVTIANSSANPLSVSSSGGLSSGGNLLINPGSLAMSLPAAWELDIGSGAAFSGADASFSGPISWDGSGNLTAASLAGIGSGLTGVPPNNTNFSTYAVGTAYTLTGSSAAITFGTTSPVLTINQAGTYLVQGAVGIKYNGATYAGPQTCTLKFRRTNNTATDLTNGSRTVEMPVLTTFTGGDVFTMPTVIYTATSGDTVTIFGILSATPAAGSVLTDSAEIVALRIR